MKNAATSSFRALQAARVRTGASATRAISASSICRDASAEAESSSATDSGAYASRSANNANEEWKRNLNEVREWRRRKAGVYSTLPLYIPEGVKVKQSTETASPKDVTLSTLMAAGAALGHDASMLSPPFTPYVYGTRSGLSVIDLEQTLPLLRRASALVRDVVKANGIVLFIGTRKGHARPLSKIRERLEDNGFIAAEWNAGTITNSNTYFGLDPLTKGYHTPDLVILLNPAENLAAIRECSQFNIPTIGIVDSDTDPRVVTYAIPANIESARTVELITGTLAIAGQEGRRLRFVEEAKKAAADKLAGKRKEEARIAAAQAAAAARAEAGEGAVEGVEGGEVAAGEEAAVEAGNEAMRKAEE